MKKSLKQQSISGVVWSSIEKFSFQGINFVIAIILARMLSPSDFGLVGMLAIFIAFSQVFIDSGFSSALIQKQNRTDADFSTSFWVNLFISVFFFVLLFVFAPHIAKFYGISELTSITRAIATTLIINALCAVHKTKLVIAVDFKTQAKASFPSTVLSGIIAIVCAYEGCGVWALVYQSILNSVFTTVFLYILVRWIPKFSFSKESFHTLFSFGSKLLMASIIHTIYSNSHSLVIGKIFNATSLGYYTRANQFSVLAATNASGIISRVTFPILSEIQNDLERLSKIYRKYIKLACFVFFPMMTGLAALAPPIIHLLLGDVWRPTIILLQLLCFAAMWDPLCSININLLYVKGRSDLVLKLEIIKKTLAITILIISAFFGLKAICIGQICYSCVAVFLNTYYTGKLIDLPYYKQIKDVFPYLILSITMGIIVLFGSLFITKPILQIVIGIPFGLVFYCLVAYVLELDAMQELKRLIFENKK